MHELAIAQSIHASVLREMKTHNLATVARIGLSIGRLSGVVADALEFGFDAVKKGTPLAHARLEIKHCPGRGFCAQCDTHFDMNDLFFMCPECNSVNVTVTNGKELDITYLEVDE